MMIAEIIIKADKSDPFIQQIVLAVGDGGRKWWVRGANRQHADILGHFPPPNELEPLLADLARALLENPNGMDLPSISAAI
jgi:hypothetical protein